MHNLVYYRCFCCATKMASTSCRFKELYNPEDPEDAQKLLAMLDDDELDEECERVLKELQENSDIEYCSDDDNEEDIPLQVLAEKIRIGADKLSQNQEKAINQEMDIQALVESTEQFIENEEVEIPDNYLGFNLTCTSKDNIIWRQKKFHPNITDINISDLDTLEDSEVLPPIEYFFRYIPEHLFATMAEMTNIYALQQDKNNFKQTNSNEIKVFVGSHLLMSCLKFPRIRMYWDTEFKMLTFSENMARNRFFQLRTTIHIVNNLEKPNNCSDKLYKVRPIYDSLQNRCRQLKMEKDLSVDEQMVPFRGQLSIKQYVKGKPNPWGIKIFMLCGRSGMMHDFIIYQGSTTELDPQVLKKFGLGASVVLHLSKNIPEQRNLYFDNYFSTYQLFEILLQKKINAAGTVRVNRFKNPPLINDKDAAKKKRGFSEEVTSHDNKVVLCKWVDNRSVVLASNFVGIGNQDEVQRWNNTDKKYISIKRPEVVKLYNQSMGGVDKIDHLLALYRIYIRSRKWTLRMLFHAMDLAVVNSWIEYKMDHENTGSKEKPLDLLHFKLRIAYALIKMNQPVSNSKKRGRPSSEPSSRTNSPAPAPRKKSNEEQRPHDEIRHDQLDHMPNYDNKKEATRCKFEKCDKKTHVYCDKCKIHLCFLKERNCFLNFHRR